MYAAYALSSIMSPTSSLMDMRAAGAIPALISVLNTSKVSLTPPCCCSCAAQTGSGPPEVDLTQSTGREVAGALWHFTLRRWTWLMLQVIMALVLLRSTRVPALSMQHLDP